MSRYVSIDSNGSTVLLEPVGTKKSMFGVIRDKNCDFWSFEVFLLNLLWSLVSPENVIVAVEGAIQMDVSLIRKPSLIYQRRITF